jgi:hypothetical protein
MANSLLFVVKFKIIKFSSDMTLSLFYKLRRICGAYRPIRCFGQLRTRTRNRRQSNTNDRFAEVSGSVLKECLSNAVHKSTENPGAYKMATRVACKDEVGLLSDAQIHLT